MLLERFLRLSILSIYMYSYTLIANGVYKSICPPLSLSKEAILACGFLVRTYRTGSLLQVLFIGGRVIQHVSGLVLKHM